MKKIKILIFISFLILIAPKLYSQSAHSYESPLEIENLNKALKKVLKKVDKNGFEKIDETDGFKYKYESKWFSAYNYQIYISKLFKNTKKTILRIEGNLGIVLTFSRIFDIEGVINKNSSLIGSGKVYTLSEKSYLMAQPLTLISPSLSVIYQSYNSPILQRGQAISRAINYFLLDILAYWIGGNRFFTTSHRPNKNQKFIFYWLAANRAYATVQTTNVVRAHNNLVKFAYSFPIED